MHAYAVQHARSPGPQQPPLLWRTFFGRRLPVSCAARRRHHRDRLARAVQWTGRLLCWSLATGMPTAATELLLTPQAGWWPALWPRPWYLTCSTALAGVHRYAEDDPAVPHGSLHVQEQSADAAIGVDAHGGEVPVRHQ
ncbi:hypothetical protein [Streptomyces sp. YIM B13518]|uniref:hypothetical protein n=1 Tax=Streptomyces sp. YIM B13518 TaxID=3366316 RepID=UPI00369D42D7